ncbi:NADP-dependent oxidoreductase [Pseudolysobacter antarcticus]|nr:NADP-dependent oxidoreductase [Pseudolysobacter antarcticus]
MLNSFGSADNFALAHLPIPEIRSGEVRIRVQAAAFNPVDYQIRKGQSEGGRLRSMILGRDLSGSIDAIHDDVKEFSIGDEVFSYVSDLASNGTYAEYVCVPAELVARKPETLTHTQAAAVPVAGITASLALSRAQAEKTKSVFIAGGAGGVGGFAIMLARQLGVKKLVTTAGNAKSRAYLINQYGLNDDQIVDYNDADFMRQAMARNRGWFDIALDLVGGKMLSACCGLLAVDGNLASVTEAPKESDFETLFQKNASFHSVGANAYSLKNDRVAWLRYREILDSLSRHFEGRVVSPPHVRIIGNLSPEVVRQAHLLLESGSVQGKLAMTC